MPVDMSRQYRKDPPMSDMKTLDDLVEDFTWRFPRARRDTVLLRCQAAGSFKEAVWLATNSIDQRGKMHPHQVKVRKTSRDEFAKIICSPGMRPETEGADSFNMLWQTLDEVKPWGIGELTVYDVATRVGGYLELEPDMLYLHTGVRGGWLALVARFSPARVGYWRGQSVVSPNVFPAPLLRLTVDEAEDFLCTYRDEFQGLENIQ